MSLRLSEPSVELSESDDRPHRAPGKVTLTQRMARGAASPPPLITTSARAAVQRAALAHELTAAFGFAEHPLDRTDAAAAASPVQRHGDAHTGLPDAAVATHAAAGISGAGGVLPHLDSIQRAFGPAHDLSGVRAHVGGAAAEASSAIGAHAYATGNDIAFASSPDLFLAAHEATHIVQQRQGVHLKGAVGQAGDCYEQHADTVAAAVVRGEDVAELLGHGSGATTEPAVAAVQRKAANSTTTPTDPPPPLPAAAHAATGPHTDAEGNTIAEANGHWHLLDEQPDSGTAHKWKSWPGRKLELVPINPDAAFTALRAAAETIRAEQIALAESLKQGKSDRGEFDQKYWFAKVYALVTIEELTMVDGGHYQYPHMKLQEVIHFYRTYRANLDAWMSNAVASTKPKVEAHWAKAFASAEAEAGHTVYKPESLEIFHAMLPSMQAHIRFDLPRSIATVFQLHYAGIPGVDLGDFKTDFDNMMPVFDRAGAELTTEIGGIAPLASPLSPFMFEIAGEREQTWEKAMMLSNQMEANAGRSSAAVNKSFEKTAKSTLTAAHPNSSSGAFSVDGESFEGEIDWTNQPGKRADAKGPGDAFEPGKPAPAFPSKLFFKKNRPTVSDKLEDAIRDDQDLAPYLALADWSREVRGATVTVDAHASAEGDSADNFALSVRRAALVRDFLAACGADWDNNTLVLLPTSELAAGAEDPGWRFARIKVLLSGTSRQLQHLANGNLPSEVAKR